MSSIEPGSFPKVLTLYLELSQYPILASRIRKRMRAKLFERGVISPEDFDAEVREKAVQSQRREGLEDPYTQEPPEIWSKRLSIIRDNLTDFYFAYNLPHELFEDIVRDVLADRVPSQDIVLTFHPELAPWDMLFSQGEAYESLPPEERARVEHDLQEIKVVLIKSMISDHLEYLGIAKSWFDVADLKEIRARRLGRGKIGGKAAGIKLAECILRKSADPGLLERIKLPASWFIGADVFYQFTQMNGLLKFANQKYKSEAEIRQEYPTIRDKVTGGSFPEEIADGLEAILEDVGDTPLIVRSSSLLEDSFGTSFAGKYESYFCPNQGTPEENLQALVSAIVNVYASVYSPDVLLYRRKMGLVDYDERMAILIQEVVGREQEDYYLPDAAGVAFSRNQFRWSPRIDREAGFLRMVWGLGTRAVETVAGDYPRLVALSHPELRPEATPRDMRRYSQSKVDLLDLADNEFRSLPVAEVVRSDTRHLRWFAQRFRQGTFEDFLSRPLQLDPRQVVVTFSDLLRKSEFPDLMRSMLDTLERAYQMPVDTEFALLLHGENTDPEPTIALLQCRPQSRLEMEAAKLPKNVPESRQLFTIDRVVPEGHVSDIRYVVYVDPASYKDLPADSRRKQLAEVIGRINTALEDEEFIIIGPGRWGSANPELGVPVTYSDIYNARAMIEVFEGGSTPEPSYGSHFFQDLVEAKIYPLAIAADGKHGELNKSFFDKSENALGQLLPQAIDWSDVIQVIDFEDYQPPGRLELVMDGEADQAMAYLRTEGPADRSSEL
ncbi:MAG: PEP/pyruvate-binding domain-containing protein [Anaerolineales bacterium]|nr:PEP/pyruvate-binding domain-containing protein [Anaerolineales bacterium]